MFAAGDLLRVLNSITELEPLLPKSQLLDTSSEALLVPVCPARSHARPGPLEAAGSGIGGGGGSAEIDQPPPRRAAPVAPPERARAGTRLVTGFRRAAWCVTPMRRPAAKSPLRSGLCGRRRSHATAWPLHQHSTSRRYRRSGCGQRCASLKAAGKGVAATALENASSAAVSADGGRRDHRAGRGELHPSGVADPGGRARQVATAARVACSAPASWCVRWKGRPRRSHASPTRWCVRSACRASGRRIRCSTVPSRRRPSPG